MYQVHTWKEAATQSNQTLQKKWRVRGCCAVLRKGYQTTVDSNDARNSTWQVTTYTKRTSHRVVQLLRCSPWHSFPVFERRYYFYLQHFRKWRSYALKTLNLAMHLSSIAKLWYRSAETAQALPSLDATVPTIVVSSYTCLQRRG